jgi:accessory gene regulator protein AgrB
LRAGKGPPKNLHGNAFGPFLSIHLLHPSLHRRDPVLGKKKKKKKKKKKERATLVLALALAQGRGR